MQRRPSRRKIKNGKREQFHFDNLRNEDAQFNDQQPSTLSNQLPNPIPSSNPPVASTTSFYPAKVALPPLFNPLEVKKTLRRTDTPPSLFSSTPSTMGLSVKESKPPSKRTLSSSSLDAKQPLKGKDALMQWCRNCTANYANVDIKNFTTSWSDGLAFAAIIHHHRPSAINFKLLKKENREENLRCAFRAAEKLGVTPLLGMNNSM